MCNIQVKTVALRFSNNQTFDCLKMSNNKGVRRLTIRNLGQTTLIIKDDSFEPIAPGETFTINSDLLVTNQKLQLDFENQPGMTNDAILRYLVDECQ